MELGGGGNHSPFRNIPLIKIFKMANFLLLFLATIFAVAKAGPLSREFGVKNSEEENVFELGDQNGDGQWSFEEFVAFVAKQFGYSKMQAEKMLEIPEMREIFDEFDTNGDGQWSKGEFGVVYDSKDKEAKRKMEIVEFKLMDSNGDGAVDFDEFVDFFAEKRGLDKEERDGLAKSKEMHSAFEWMDANGDGKIEMEEMVEMENGTTSTPPSSPSSSSPPAESSTPPPSSSSPSPSTPPPFFPPPELIFGRIDANNDGFLVYKECMHFVGNYLLDLSENQNARMEESPIPAELFEGIDWNEDGQISMGEFVESYPDILGKKFLNKMLTVIFDMADENGDGALDYEEFVDSEAEREGMGYQKRNRLARSERMRAEFGRIDRDGDGQISLGELMASMDGQSGTSTQAPSTSTPTQTEPSTSTTQQMETTPEGTSTTTSNPFVPKMEEIFKQFDANNDGQWELDEALDYYGNMTKLTEEEKERVGRSRSFGEIFYALDTDGDGKLSLNEFENVMEMNPEEMTGKLFKVMDLDGDGFVEFGELVAFFGDMQGMDEEEREEFGNDQILKVGFEEADKNGDGKLDLEEFNEEMLGGMSAKMLKSAMEM